ncbi:hypothetical protein LTR35_007529 [Friedmanniomyces endolithicus]|uniref:Uncharacterized protein n=1 Tax=Friedmanniomyces endolithicus TaxID=329885 RepID=A0AAN6FGY5_9PEZI|nr:hypothetical protein LTR35_007529 [Friedmanniomyces endolithicus]KAK0295117.1 hypothetical protein LTS00_006173 [Friedmanniomyces endolithicus]KAK0313842.1 hypothetical protein LTR01_002099 [Friedmanniomyces endolithicus]KAK0317326.1 hypothetical protein LTR82_011649 [Friedmanniomyces endolithicus]KAK0831416.1 hypothetical protein LTR73_002798 [Friedmanniomyces endolithicus]
MKLPYLPHTDLHIARPHHHTLDALVDNGKKAMHLMSKTLVERATTSSSAASSSTCEPGNTAAICAKPTDGMNTQTLPIVLGAVFVKRQRIEDANDPHKSLDFGVDMAPSKPRRKHGDIPEMKVTDMSGGPSRPGQRGRGMSMDMSNPYLMPAGLQDSRESIHSMSRSMHDKHDPYRPVAMLRYSTESSRPYHDNASQYSASTLHSTNEKVNLLAHAQKAPRSDPRVASPLSAHTSKSSDDLLVRQMHSNGRSAPHSRKTSLGSTDQLLPNLGETPPPREQFLPKSLPVPPPPPALPVEQERRTRTTSQPATRPPRKSSASASATARKPIPVQQHEEPSYFPPVAAQPGYDIDPAMISVGRYSIDTPNPSQQYPVEQKPVSAMGRRPLPPDMPEENAELRANRIRSFYKEYFDDSRPRPAPAHYEEDYDAGYADAAIYDPETGGFAMPGRGRPFAQPVGRRAMTPPPRGAPALNHNRHYSSQSASRPQNRGRARTGGPPPPPMLKKKTAPPKPLQGLPTPHKLRDFDSVISSPIDFAPPSTYRHYQNGSAPSSPTGPRPYSPSVRAFNPLASSYDELSVVPSPHLLRNSSTFTGLDFAPPNRLGAHNESGGSDAGSVRSARSGISARQLDAVRAGAYRVSRIPKEMVTSREDLTAQLRPKLSMVTPG